ncbi:MAG: helix-turn-helix domain-containing protein [Verrucomicrobiota bacterium]
MKPGPEKQFDTDVALTAAMEVFWARGYEAASLSELIRRMGIGKKSLYDTFGNKRALFLQALELYSEKVASEIEQRLKREGSAFGNLVELLDLWADQHSNPGSVGCLIGNNVADFDTNDEQVAAILAQKLRHMEGIFFDVLNQARKDNEVRADLNVSEAAKMLVCLTQGLALVGRVQRSDEVLKGTVRSAISLLKPS